MLVKFLGNKHKCSPEVFSDEGQLNSGQGDQTNVLWKCVRSILLFRTINEINAFQNLCPPRNSLQQLFWCIFKFVCSKTEGDAGVNEHLPQNK